MSEFQSAYALARHVAHQLPQHDGKSARELYQAFLPDFAKLGTDGSTGATMITQHLRKLEQEGLVISEKGKLRGNPSKWFWTGPTDASAEPERIEPFATGEPRPASEPLSRREPAEGSEPNWLREPCAQSDPHEDPWDLLARQFASACREQAAADISISGIDDLDTKLLVIDRLKPIVSTDIADVLDAIGDDLIKIRGVTP